MSKIDKVLQVAKACFEMKGLPVYPDPNELLLPVFCSELATDSITADVLCWFDHVFDCLNIRIDSSEFVPHEYVNDFRVFLNMLNRIPGPYHFKLYDCGTLSIQGALYVPKEIPRVTKLQWLLDSICNKASVRFPACFAMIQHLEPGDFRSVFLDKELYLREEEKLYEYHGH